MILSPPQKTPHTCHTHTHFKVKSVSILVSQGTRSKQNNASVVLATEALLFMLLSWQKLRANPKIFVSTGAFPILPRLSLANNKCKGRQDYWLFITEREIVTAFLGYPGKQWSPPSAAFDLWLQWQKAGKGPNGVKKRNDSDFTSHCLE